MSKARVGVLIAVSAFMAVIGFNNCSKVDFDGAQVDAKAAAQGAEQVSGEEENLGAIPVTEDEIKEVVDQLPPGEIDIIRPVTDLENDPNLYEIYKCGDGGVLICHFPGTVESLHSLCIGRSAVKTHYDHIRSYVSNGENKTISDYLGPCRTQL